MKNVMFVIRDGYDADYIIVSLASELKKKYNMSYVLETGSMARKKKFKQMIKRQGILALMNMAYLVLYDRIMMKDIKAELGNPVKPKEEQYFKIDDVNLPEIMSIKEEINPDIVIVYGSGIIKQPTIDGLGVDIFNIHSSVLPYYRNVHSDFWAYQNKDYDKIGISIFKLDAGIDSGDIAMQKVSNRQDKLSLYKAENLKTIVEMLPQFLDKYFSGAITLGKQDEKYATKAVTPSSRDIRAFLKGNR